MKLESSGAALSRYSGVGRCHIWYPEGLALIHSWNHFSIFMMTINESHPLHKYMWHHYCEMKLGVGRLQQSCFKCPSNRYGVTTDDFFAFKSSIRCCEMKSSEMLWDIRHTTAGCLLPRLLFVFFRRTTFPCLENDCLLHISCPVHMAGFSLLIHTIHTYIHTYFLIYLDIYTHIPHHRSIPHTPQPYNTPTGWSLIEEEKRCVCLLRQQALVMNSHFHKCLRNWVSYQNDHSV